MISLNNSWDEIKDLLRLKLCNADIHMYTSQFMEIQHGEKESLAAYVHWFKTEAKMCNFTNDVATIRIFIKSLKNGHSLVTHIYEKGLQTLNDTISKVEKLNAVQQLTATITSPSTVNMMTNDEDRCFQCQEHGHIVRNFSNIRCFECDEYGHIVMDCPQRFLLWEPQQSITYPTCTKVTTPDQVPDTTMRTGTGEAIQGLSHDFTDTAAQVFMILIEAILDQDIGIITSITGVAHNAAIPHTGVIVIDLAMTLYIDHTADHLHTEAHHTTPEIEAC